MKDAILIYVTASEVSLDNFDSGQNNMLLVHWSVARCLFTCRPLADRRKATEVSSGFLGLDWTSKRNPRILLP